MKKKKHVISRVLPGSIGEELELEPGDILAAVSYTHLSNDDTTADNSASTDTTTAENTENN